MPDMDEISELLQSEPESKKDKFHRNLKITFVIIGIITLTMSALINYHTLKKIIK